jgi:hypothetical protein
VQAVGPSSKVLEKLYVDRSTLASVWDTRTLIVLSVLSASMSIDCKLAPALNVKVVPSCVPVLPNRFTLDRRQQ